MSTTNANPVEAVVTDRPGAERAIAKPMHPAKRVIVRVVRVYLQSFVGFLGAANIPAVGNILPQAVETSLNLNMYRVAAVLAIPPTTMTLIHNTLDMLARIDEKMPEMRA